MVDREGPIHRSILAYLHAILPGALIHSSPNSFGDMTGPGIARQVAKARNMGMRPGWPDIEVFWQGRGLFFEVKAEGGKLQDHQKALGQALIAQGMKWAVVRSIDDVREWLTAWDVQL